MFWLGLYVGLSLGAILGIFLAGLLMASRKGQMDD